MDKSDKSAQRTDSVRGHRGHVKPIVRTQRKLTISLINFIRKLKPEEKAHIRQGLYEWVDRREQRKT